MGFRRSQVQILSPRPCRPVVARCYGWPFVLSRLVTWLRCRSRRDRTSSPGICSSRSISAIFMELQGEEGFPHKGTVNFVDNHVNRETGSLLVRGVFANPLLPCGPRLRKGEF